MTIDYARLLLDPIYQTLGVPAVVTLADLSTVDITVVDKTANVAAGDHDTKVDSVGPAANMRHYEWLSKGKTIEDLEGASVEFNGSHWNIVAYPRLPVPTGSRMGEVQLVLENETYTGEPESWVDPFAP